jgi:DNA-binding transcriptional LysR family regulator
MEQRLGVRLIERSSRRFMLTDEGAFLHERAVNIVRDVDEAEAATRAHNDVAGGLLRIGAPNAFGRHVVAPLLAEFRLIHPQLEVLLVLSDAGLSPVDDDLDMVLRNGVPDDPAVVVRKLLTSRRLVCATPQYLQRHGTPTTPADLRQHDCIRLVRGRRVFDEWPFMVDGRRQVIRVRGTLATTSGEVLHDWTLAGAGLGLKALWDVRKDLQEGNLVECLREYWCDEISLFAVYASHAHIPKRCRAFTEFLTEALQAE